MSDTDDIEIVRITAREYSAAFEIRGLKEKAHWMVMTAEKDEAGSYVLQGSPQAFDELASDLLDEMEYRISPKISVRALRRLYNRLPSDNCV